MIQSITDTEFEMVRKLAREFLGFELAESKRTLVVSRLGKRLQDLGLKTIMDYLYYIRDNASGEDELIQLINKITTNETSFFRENHHFEFINEKLFPFYEKRKKEEGISKIRIWCAGCSSGEEPYTLAIIIREYFKALTGWDIRILATDISTKVLKIAEEGVFSAERVKEQVPEPIIRKYFHKINDDKYAVSDSLKSLISFKRLNLMDDKFPIKSDLDIIFCRNVMIYFRREVKIELLRKFASYLGEGAFLFVGHSENLFSISNQFSLIMNTIYRKNDK